MQSSNDTFAALVTQFPEYPALEAYLTNQGIQVNTKDGDQLVIFRYNREKCDLTSPVVRAFRSVVWDRTTNRPVFVAPMKSEADVANFPTSFTNTHIVEDFVDGVMVNVFYDQHKQSWRLATRSRLDADNKFYQHNFADLFMSAWNAYFPGAGFASLTPGYGYSFVVQHPQNRIVVPAATPTLTCVEIHHVDQATARLFITPTPANMMAPRRFNVTNIAELAQLMSQREQFEGYTAQGCVVRDIATGRRWKRRTVAYQQVRQLRGNHSRLEYTWFENYQKGTLPAFLAVYPEETAAANALIQHWTVVVSDVYNWYVKVFKVRDTPKEAIPPQYKGVLFDLHGQYLSRLAPAKQTLNWKECQSIMARQDLKRQVFLATFKPGGGPPKSAKVQPQQVVASASQMTEVE